jgi:peroxiredoxin Q/BCP
MRQFILAAAVVAGCTAIAIAQTAPQAPELKVKAGDKAPDFSLPGTVAYFMVSVDTPEDNKGFAEKEKADFPMLSDPEKKVAEAYGVLSGSGLARRWTFFIGPDGKILHVETQGHTTDAGDFLTKKLTELGVKKK